MPAERGWDDKVPADLTQVRGVRGQHFDHRFRRLGAAPLRAAVYGRFSTDNQRDASIEDQVRICCAGAERERWVIAETFTDYAVSGSTTLRPGYQALMSAMRLGRVDVVLAESLDRLPRDQEHVAGFHKAAQFAGVRIITLSEGEISELHVGLKGTMGALYLKDLADKTRRGLEGRVRDGRSGGGLCYGYRVIRGPMDRRGELERGLREIDPAQAAVVIRIFESFAAGEGPTSIAAALNREGTADPRGGIWQVGTIRGQALRDTGILRNRLYIGELVWNQRRWVKDPGTGQRVARANSKDFVVTETVPELRIVEQGLWDKVQARLAKQRAAVEESDDGQTRRRFWEQKRPLHLLTGRVFCGGCGALMQASGKDYLACRVAIAHGPCTNRRSVRRGALEGRILDALGSELMRPDLVAVFAEEFTQEWNRLAVDRSSERPNLQRELGAVERKLSGLIDAIADGLRAPGLQGRLDTLTGRKAELERLLVDAEAASATPSLHPNLAEVYRSKVTSLRAEMQKSASPEVREALRELVSRVEVHPGGEDGTGPRIELLGHLGALLRAGRADVPATFESPVKVDAGTGFEPVTFRL
ncbi:recombinase family protein [Sediminicoccus sp. BL-A-41-H5]|uniref:recombinase family protein n=1 Tax=Sediminicoccus sp. BL-A-41-H5 TaxID=3421106 RepID=UPI003D665E8F